MIWKGTLVNPSVTLPRNVANVVHNPGVGKRLNSETVTLNIDPKNCRIWKIDLVVSRRRVTGSQWFRCLSTCTVCREHVKVAKLLRSILKFGVSVKTWKAWVSYSGQAGKPFSSHKFLVFASTGAQESQNIVGNDLVASVQGSEHKSGTHVEEEILWSDQKLISNVESNDQPEFVDYQVVAKTPHAYQSSEVSRLQMHDIFDAASSNGLSCEIENSKVAHRKDAARGQLDENKLESPSADSMWVSEQIFENYLERIDWLKFSASWSATEIQQCPSVIYKENLLEKCDKINHRSSDCDGPLISEKESVMQAGDFDNAIQLEAAKLAFDVSCSNHLLDMADEECWFTKIHQHDVNLLAPYNSVSFEGSNTEEGALQSNFDKGAATLLIGDENMTGSVVVGAKVNSNEILSNKAGQNGQAETLGSWMAVDTFQELPNMMDEERLLKMGNKGKQISEADCQSMEMGGLVIAGPNGGARQFV